MPCERKEEVFDHEFVIEWRGNSRARGSECSSQGREAPPTGPASPPRPNLSYCLKREI